MHVFREGGLFKNTKKYKIIKLKKIKMNKEILYGKQDGNNRIYM